MLAAVSRLLASSSSARRSISVLGRGICVGHGRHDHSKVPFARRREWASQRGAKPSGGWVFVQVWGVLALNDQTVLADIGKSPAEIAGIGKAGKGAGADTIKRTTVGEVDLFDGQFATA